MAQWLGLGIFTAVAWVQPLVSELRSCKPCRVAEKKAEREVMKPCVWTGQVPFWKGTSESDLTQHCWAFSCARHLHELTRVLQGSHDGHCEPPLLWAREGGSEVASTWVKVTAQVRCSWVRTYTHVTSAQAFNCGRRWVTRRQQNKQANMFLCVYRRHS